MASFYSKMEELELRWYMIANACWTEEEIIKMSKEGTPIQVLAHRCVMDTTSMEADAQYRLRRIGDMERIFRLPPGQPSVD